MSSPAPVFNSPDVPPYAPMGLNPRSIKDCQRVWNRINTDPYKVRDVPPMHVAITGAAGQIGYALSFLIARGEVLGRYQPVVLHLLEIPQAMESLKGVEMELMDGAFPLLSGTIATCELKEAFSGVDVAIMVGSVPRKPGMQRVDLLSKNAPIFKAQGEAINKYANPWVRVLVVGNPANTNALCLAQYAPNIPKNQIVSLTRLDHNRAKAQIAQHLGVPTAAVHNVITWGNHSASQTPDIRFVYVEDYPEKGIVMPLQLVEKDPKWAYDVFIPAVQQRGTAILAKRNLSAAASAAEATANCVRDWLLGTPTGEIVSMGVFTDGSKYTIQPGLCFSMPVTCRNGEYQVVDSLPIDDWHKNAMKASELELAAERDEAFHLLGLDHF